MSMSNVVSVYSADKTEKKNLVTAVVYLYHNLIFEEDIIIIGKFWSTPQ